MHVPIGNGSLFVMFLYIYMSLYKVCVCVCDHFGRLYLPPVVAFRLQIFPS